MPEIDVAVRHRSPDAERAIEWFWANGALTERHTSFIRSARTWCEQSTIRTIFERLRPPTPQRDNGRFPTLMNWLALSSALSLEEEILGWFDARVAARDLPLPTMSRLRRAILVRGRPSDWVAFGEPLDSVNDLLESMAQTREILGDTPELLEAQLAEVDREVALWRHVAELERPEQLVDLDTAIDASERGPAIRAWVARSPQALTQALLQHLVD